MSAAEAKSLCIPVTAGTDQVETSLFTFDHPSIQPDIWCALGINGTNVNFDELVQPKKLIKHPLYQSLLDAESVLSPRDVGRLRLHWSLSGAAKWVMYRWAGDTGLPGALIVQLPDSPYPRLPLVVFTPVKHYLPTPLLGE